MSADDAAMTANDQPLAVGRSWLKHPWLLLILGGVISLWLWVGLGMWIEHRRAAALAELRGTPGITISDYEGLDTGRLPIWLPRWLGRWLPEEWQSKVSIHVHGTWEFSKPLSDRELVLLDRVSGISGVTFRDPQAVSDDALLALIERSPLVCLRFSGFRRLMRQHFAALASKELYSLEGLQGPFDQPMLDELAKIKTLQVLRLDGPLDESARFGSMPALEFIEWRHSELNDDQFASLSSCGTLHSLRLSQTRLAARSWPVLEKLQLETLELESPHINDATVHSLTSQKSMRRVRLHGGKLSDAGVKELVALPELIDVDVEGRDLTIASARLLRSSTQEWTKRTDFFSNIVIRGGSHVTNEWLAELVGGERFNLALVDSAITDEGIEHLKGSYKFNRLALPGSRITDRSLPIFSTLKSLYSLDLRNTAITDAGLQHFSPDAIPYSYSLLLHVGGTRVTKRGVEELLSRYSNVEVYGVEGIQSEREFIDLIPLDDDQLR